MPGLEISKKYYEEYGLPMIHEMFSDVENRIAAGLCGQGSECFGFDDEVSRDHDFCAGFCLWLTGEDYEKFGFKLERAYSKLPKEYMGLKRSLISPVGGNRHGVMVIDEFYRSFLGTKGVSDNLDWWLYVPSHSLACACNGEVFSDPLGIFSSVRQILLAGYPEDVRRKKLSAHIIMAAQSGQYNYGRCISHGESGAAQLAIFEFVKHIISAVYLLNNKYEPFYKWVYRGMRELPILGDIEPLLTSLSELDNSKVHYAIKQEVIEDIASSVIGELQKQNLTDAMCTNLETHAYSVADKIKDNNLRNMHIMEGI